MGCISSKEMVRSASHHRHGMKGRSRSRMSRDVPEVTEDLLFPRKGGNPNHFLALVCAATSVSDAFRPKSLRFEFPVSPAETEANGAILKPDTVDDIDNDRRIEEYEALPGSPRRSRSWHSYPLEETINSDKENGDVDIDTSEVRGKGAIRSRSFHTVEEYDKLLERIWSVSLADNDHKEACPVNRKSSMAPTAMNFQAVENNTNSEGTPQHLQGNGSLAEESSTNDETTKESFPSESTPVFERKDQEQVSVETDIPGESCLKNDDPQERCVMAKGFKRKSIARRLETLKIPSTFELPAVASLREWLPAGHVLSAGVHPTPDCFVSTGKTANMEEGSIFDEELVTVLEEQLQQLKAEEETILKTLSSLDQRRSN